MIYNFRHDKSQSKEILRRIADDNQLSQGWGGGAGADLDLRKEGFVGRTFAHYPDLSTTRIPSNLTRMMRFEDGDLLVVPHLPEHGKASVHIVDGAFPSCYSYDPSDDDHLNHRIALRQSYGLDGEISIYNAALLPWRAKLQWLRLPVLAIPDFSDTFAAVVAAMTADRTLQFGPSEMDDFLGTVASKVENVVTEQLRSMPPAGGAISFEGLCERILKSNGYEIEARNQYDRQGGDIDLRCKRPRRDTSIFESGDVVLFVQVKKHEGTTDDTGVRQVIQMIEREPHADGCVMSMADEFTAAARQLADSNGIVLLDRHDICALLLPQLSELSGSAIA